LFLPPRNTQEIKAIKPSGGSKGRIASLLWKAQQGHKPLLPAIPILIIAAFMIYSQGSQTKVAGPGTQVLDEVPRNAPRPATRSTSNPQAKATLSFALTPWGEVYIDGKKVGISPPLGRLKLEPGKRRLEIRNRGFAPYRKTVDLKAGQSLKIRHKFK
jgi:serine/threonine-protein kinase